MNEQARTALEESIAHWERLASGDCNPGERPSWMDCALCTTFNNADCTGCPVRERTGKPDCYETPYHTEGVWDLYEEKGLDSDEFKAAARKELKFLKSLRD